MNADGRDDFIWYESAGTLRVALSNGSTFSSSSRWSSTAFTTSYGVWVADVTGDGKSDIVYRYYTVSGGCPLSCPPVVYLWGRVRRSDGATFLAATTWY
ncbi:hypothetical protein COCOR_02301 [Corallococcus coralloides DSM 2259]|uniref:VCBS repeat-containing protein n=1 Tax=Corallococcus coralloides (strain ATCC 25202 / DSM 2259 / NBRC 100086 / M2) TaxID=1144275 RepID=H8MLV3_CORCM|nr:FG-GAP-like repeat-containing protein [Corallococcus coralloides]AFE04590.1 hypothetical protein COCOR_02301 [Corallococcus coralloides DSM 2259]